jgi:hypothetical protein
MLVGEVSYVHCYSFAREGERCQSLQECGLIRVCASTEAANQAGKAR